MLRRPELRVPSSYSYFTKLVFVACYGFEWLTFIVHNAIWLVFEGLLRVVEMFDILPEWIWSPCWMIGHRDNEVIWHPENLSAHELAKYPNGYEVKHCDVCRRTVVTEMQ